MKISGMKIILFGGTAEGREIAASGLPVFYSATTEYGAGLADFPNAEPIVGRMDMKAMSDFMSSRPVAGAIDATHPYAAEATENIRAACARSDIPYLRVSRGASDTDGTVPVADCGEAAEFLRKFLAENEGNVLLTVGGKELEKFSALPGQMKKRLYARVLPLSKIIESCERLGFDAGHIIAMKGPFTKAMNLAALEMTGSRVLVTKDGGAAGGLGEKLAAARETGAAVVLVRRPEESGVTADEAVKWGFNLLGLEPPPRVNKKNKTLNKWDSQGPKILEWGLGQSPGAVPDKIPAFSLLFPPFPLFIDIAGRRAVVVGGGKIAARRVKTLLTCGADVTVVSPAIGDFLSGMAKKFKYVPRAYRKGDLDGSEALAVAASNDRSVNREVGLDAKKLNVPVSVADAPEECTFFFPALAEFDGAAAAVSTGGRSPSLCHTLAERLREEWPGWVKEMRDKQ